MASKLIGGVNKTLTAYYRLSIKAVAIDDCIVNFHIYGIESPRSSISTSRGQAISPWAPGAVRRAFGTGEKAVTFRKDQGVMVRRADHDDQERDHRRGLRGVAG
jgi:hypothetical protein